MTPPDLVYRKHALRITAGAADRREILARECLCTPDEVVEGLLRVGTPEQVRKGLAELLALAAAAREQDRG